MDSWTSGYVADIGYTHGCYTELNPKYAEFAFLSKGLVFPKVRTACELGFGQGLSTLIHSACSDTAWYGTDFNPSQAAAAADIAAHAGLEVNISDDSFSEYLSRTDLPKFDFIGLHGVWSWVSAENQKAIVDFVRQKLNLGGVLYVSYNTLPGWSTFEPVRHLMDQYARNMVPKAQGINQRVSESVKFIGKLIEADSTFVKANPVIKERVEKLEKANVNYLAHEYFNKDWSPTHFAHFAEALQPAKLSYACPAGYKDHIDSLALSEKQREFLAGLKDEHFRQSAIDFLTNKGFRREYWVKGPRVMPMNEQVECFKSKTLILMKHPEEIKLIIESSVGEVGLKEEVYSPIIEIFAKEIRISVRQLAELLKDKKIDDRTLFQAVTIMLSKGDIGISALESEIAEARPRSQQLNRILVESAKTGSEIRTLASPVFSGGVGINRLEQLMLLASSEGAGKKDELVGAVWGYLQQANQKLVKEGVRLESEADYIEHLNELTSQFLDKRLPILKRAELL